VQAAPPPKVVERQSYSFARKLVRPSPNPRIDQLTRWRDPVCPKVVGLIPQQARSRLRSPHDQLLDEPGRSAPSRWPPDRPSPHRSLPRTIVRNADGSCNAAGVRGAR